MNVSYAAKRAEELIKYGKVSVSISDDRYCTISFNISGKPGSSNSTIGNLWKQAIEEYLNGSYQQRHKIFFMKDSVRLDLEDWPAAIGNAARKLAEHTSNYQVSGGLGI